MFVARRRRGELSASFARPTAASHSSHVSRSVPSRRLVMPPAFARARARARRRNHRGPRCDGNGSDDDSSDSHDARSISLVAIFHSMRRIVATMTRDILRVGSYAYAVVLRETRI